MSSLLRRMKDISVATLNELLEQSEDPIRLIDKYLAAQREQIEEAERLYRQCLAHAQSLRHQYMNADEMRQKREQQALLALKAGEEETARLALHEKMHYEEKYERYKELYEQSRETIIELEEQIRQLKDDYREVVDKRGYYIARLETARLQQRMNERIGFGPQLGQRAFDRLEERVSDLEMEARTLRDVRRMGAEPLYRAGGSFRPDVERELDALRKKLEDEGWNR
jgi:phage shock protein A